MNYRNTTRILAQGRIVSNDTWATGCNNNDLVIGPSGAGKTRSYVKPNLLQCAHSLIVADTKGSLLREAGPVMAAQGFEVRQLDFADLFCSSVGYDPLRYIRRDRKTGRWSEQDILQVCACLHPVESLREPFWDQAAQSMLAALVAYALEALPEKEHELITVSRLFDMMGSERLGQLFGELEEEDPGSYAVRAYRRATANKEADRTFASVKMMLAESLSKLTVDGMAYIYRHPAQVDFAALGRRRTALFLTISDTDRSKDKLVSLFYAQALQALCESADRDYEDCRLPVPVRLILDDFATNVCIPDFDKIISVIRSREIYVSLVVQSITQLYSMYGEYRAKTIINNCDSCLYLGGQDLDTAAFISVKAHRSRETILDMPRGDAWLFIRGEKPAQVKKYDLQQHPLFPETPEGKKRRAAQKAARPAGLREQAGENSPAACPPGKGAER